MRKLRRIGAGLSPKQVTHSAPKPMRTLIASDIQKEATWKVTLTLQEGVYTITQHSERKDGSKSQASSAASTDLEVTNLRWESIKELFPHPQYYWAEFHGTDTTPVMESNEGTPEEPDPSPDYSFSGLAATCSCGLAREECALVTCGMKELATHDENTQAVFMCDRCNTVTPRALLLRDEEDNSICTHCMEELYNS